MGVFSLHGLGGLIPQGGKFQHFFLSENSVLEDDSVPIDRACVVAHWFDEHDISVIHMPRPCHTRSGLNGGFMADPLMPSDSVFYLA